MNINGERLWASIQELAEIGGTPKGGVCRLALTETDGRGRDQFCGWAREAGCGVTVDGIGNIFARREGEDASASVVMMGSHLDTQPTGGKFDGIYGVLSGLEVLRTLRERKVKTVAPVEVVVWTNEEGSRFVPVMMGSGVYANKFELNEILRHTDVDGVAVGDELRKIGYAGTAHFSDVRARSKCYFEAHIEQGPVLERKDVRIGAVTGALGQRWYDVVVQGRESHAGSTPMDMRKDALLAASNLVVEVNRIALDAGGDARGTVGWLDNYPNSRNVIPGRVKLTVDLRAENDAKLSAMDRTLHEWTQANAEKMSVGIEVKQVVYFPPQEFNPAMVETVREASDAAGFNHMDIVSGAGHDAIYLADVTPAAMIFIPCKGGISHNETEYAKPEDVAAGCEVLYQAVLEQAGVR